MILLLRVHQIYIQDWKTIFGNIIRTLNVIRFLWLRIRHVIQVYSERQWTLSNRKMEDNKAGPHSLWHLLILRTAKFIEFGTTAVYLHWYGLGLHPTYMYYNLTLFVVNVRYPTHPLTWGMNISSARLNIYGWYNRSLITVA